MKYGCLGLSVAGLFVGMVGTTAATWVVTSPEDSGPGSLRQAILDANAAIPSGANRIEFQLSGPEPHRLQPESPLPDIHGPLVLDGFTQPGFSGRPLVELRGDRAAAADGLRLGNGCQVQGLVINRFSQTGIRCLGGTNIIRGNFIGTDLSGKISLGNGEAGVDLFLGPGGNVLGGPTSLDRNVLSGNRWGIYLLSPGNRIQGNLVGLDVDGTLPLANGAGVVVIRSSGNLFGGTRLGEGNIIAFNALAGIAILEGTNNSIRGNRIYSNGRAGIQLGTEEVPVNDAGDVDEGPNRKQNVPELASAPLLGGQLKIDGLLRSQANTSFTLDFFASPECDPSGFGEGFLFLGSTNVATPASGSAPLSFMLSNDLVRAGWQITATATDPDGNSSGFSSCAAVVEQGLVLPVFVDHPLSQTAVQGGSVTFSASITGEPPPFEFELRRGTTPLATNQTTSRVTFFTLTHLQASDAAAYRILVRNAATTGPGIPSRNLLLTLLTDSDGDGLPDSWENGHGLGAGNPADARSDLDGDGMSNLEEYLADTDPQNRSSALHLELRPIQPSAAGSWQLGFDAVSNKTYTVQASEAAHGASWTPVFHWPARATNTPVRMTNASSDSVRYFRLVTPAQP